MEISKENTVTQGTEHTTYHSKYAKVNVVTVSAARTDWSQALSWWFRVSCSPVSAQGHGPQPEISLEQVLLTEKVGWSQTLGFDGTHCSPPHTHPFSLSSVCLNSLEEAGFEILRTFLACGPVCHLPCVWSQKVRQCLENNPKHQWLTLRSCLRLQTNGKPNAHFIWPSLTTTSMHIKRFWNKCCNWMFALQKTLQCKSP